MYEYEKSISDLNRTLEIEPNNADASIVRRETTKEWMTAMII